MRIVALSDQHGFLPDVPACDLLIVAGDVCPDGFGRTTAMQAPHQQQAWFDQTIRPWLAAAPATHKVLTWGNHDWCGEACAFSQDSPRRARSTDMQILVDDGTTIPDPDTPGVTISVWATPWSNEIGYWAFMKPRRDLEAVYAAIPAGLDILISHQPPYGHGDGVPVGRDVHRAGSRELLETIRRVRPRVVICGHIHEGFGRTEYLGVPIYNVCVVDERYRLVRAPTVIDLEAI